MVEYDIVMLCYTFLKPTIPLEEVMKLNKIALAVLATAATAASAGVTVSPILLGYHYNDEAKDNQGKILKVGNDNVYADSGLYTGAALGVELTPSTQLQVEYGVSDADALTKDAGAVTKNDRKVGDVEQQTISGNILIGTEQFSEYNPNAKFKPYVLVGAGQSQIKVKDQSGKQVSKSKDTIGNLGLGARYLVNDALALRGEVRAVHNFDNKWWEGLALAGLEVTLGGRLAPAVPVAPVAEPVVIEEPVIVEQPVIIEQPAPVVQIEEDRVVDSDFDGVPDHLDACPDTPTNIVVDARGCPVQVNVNEELRRELRVFFDRDKSAIKPQFREEVAKVAQEMQAFPNATAVIEGHASKDSNRSSAKYNQRLSEARANAVKLMLSNEFGIAPNRLNAVGYGFDRPIAPNTTEEGRALNRRVIAVISGNKTSTVEQTKDMVIQ